MRVNYGKPVAQLSTSGRGRFIDATQVRDHIQTLLDAGMNYCMIARAAGFAEGTVRRAHNGSSATVQEVVASRILAVDTRPHPQQTMVLNVGCRRRLEALMLNGFGARDIADQYGASFSQVRMWRINRWVHADTHELVCRIFADLWDKEGPSARVREFARRNRFFPASAWVDLDDYFEQPPVEAVRDARTAKGDERRLARLEQVQLLTRSGLSAMDIAVRLGVSQRQVQRDRGALREAS